MDDSNMTVVAQATQFAPDFSAGVIVVESTRDDNFGLAIEELTSAAARTLALGYAAKNGVADPRINGSTGSPYPVNRHGVALDSVKGEHGQALSATHQLMQPARYRIDIPVTRRLI